MNPPQNTVTAVPAFHMGDRLAKALDVSGVGVAEMALKLGVSRQTIGNYLSGRTTPKLATLRVWSDETGVDLEWIKEGAPLAFATPEEGAIAFPIYLTIVNGATEVYEIFHIERGYPGFVENLRKLGATVERVSA